MSINKKYLKILEFDKIISQLEKFSKTYIGKKLCLNLMPSSDEKEVIKSLNETNEALILRYKKGSLPISAISENLPIWLKTLKSGNILSISAILDLANILKLSHELKNYFFADDNISLSDFNTIYNYFNNLYINDSLENEILNIIIDDITLDDKASPTLYKIRSSKRTIEQEIRNKLNTYISSPTYSKYLQENVITIRNDRFVIPIKAEYKSQIKGFVHDISNSGSTLFLEPLSIFELNSKISDLIVEENIEIEKILSILTNKLYEIYPNLENNLRIIGQLDFIFAKANYSKEQDSVKPIINNSISDNNYNNDNIKNSNKSNNSNNSCNSSNINNKNNNGPKINLIGARHPLINPNKVVPIDINLGFNFNTLVITGPNTGGKTVTLKTVGLICLMAMAGLNIPAKENSSIYIFDNIFADIGDEQSIQESLSTFSSHMKNIIEIINSATSESLVLIDELGSGTDPIEGSSLAISILEFLSNKNILTIATTHYNEIKNYALTAPKFENASQEFDIATLTPTYHLLIGIPGKSNAFAISKKLGLPKKILNRANDFISSDNIHIEDLLKNIYNTQKQIDSEKEEINKNLKEISDLKASLSKDNSEVRNKEKAIIENAKIEARNILDEAKEEATNAIHKIRQISEKPEFNNDFGKNISASSIKDLDNYRNKLNSKLKSVSLSNLNDIDESFSININDLHVGMNVYINKFIADGVLLSLPNSKNEVQVQLGNMKTYVNISDLSISTNTNASNKKYAIPNNKNLSNNINFKAKPSHNISKALSVSPEINLLGLTVDEAVPILDKYLDDCSLAKLDKVRIVHGKGTGKLREGIHKFLRRNPHVKSFRLGTFGEGEMGVTIVEIK